jgi:DNA-directed RNA polymerase sigma subunit (sigma70/sigma32)
MDKTFSEAKENIWMDINKSMAEIWRFIQIVFEQHEMIQKARQATKRIREELGENPTKAT